MNWKRSVFVYVLLTLVGMTSFAQTPPPQNDLFYNNGQIYIDSGVVVQIFGRTLTTGPNSLLLNNGEIYVHFDTVPRYLLANVQKGFTIDNSGIVGGNGYYEIEPDWTNNSPKFNPGQSHVRLMSDLEQKITGTSPTSFYLLELGGEGLIGKERIKRMTIDAFVQDSLSLNNRELATDSFNMTIQNVETNAISHNNSLADLGFVSSLRGDTRNGSLIRRTANSSTPYFYPVGSSVNPPGSEPYFYRPVDVLPIDDNSNQYGVRFVHESPDVEGYNQFNLGDSVCSVNNVYYHMVNHPAGSSPARIKIFYDPLVDNVYDYAAQWGKGNWNLVKSSTFSQVGASYNVGLPEHPFFSFDSLPIILADRFPSKALIVGNPDVCANDFGMYRAIGKSNFYNWVVPNQMDILSETGNDTLILKVYDDGGYIQLTAESSTGKCIEASDSFLIEVHPGPTANFVVSENEIFTNQLIELRDSSLGSPIEWFWQFGDGNSASSPFTKHKFENVGEYVVEMYVKGENGCLDSSRQIISVIEGLSVPNIFTPNGDGRNDLFYIPNSGVKSYHFKVFNRWGILLFETTAPEIAWDGYNNSGNRVPEGTYFYTLVAQGDKSDYTRKGYFTLLR